MKIGHLSFEMKRLADEITSLAWQNLDNEEIFENYVKVVLPFLKAHKEGFVSTDKFPIELDSNTLKKRQKVLLKLFPLLNDRMDWLYLSSSPLLRLRLEDADWLITEWNFNEDVLIKEEILLILRDFIGSSQGFFSIGANPDFLDKIWQACETNEQFKKEVYDLFEAVELNSSKAIESKSKYDEIISWQREEKDEEELLQPPPKERVLDCLNRFENGEIEFWWHLNLQMTLKPTSRLYDELEANLTNLPGWQEADDETRTRIIEAGKKYLIEGEPNSDEWVGTNTIYRPAWAGYRAFNLLNRFAPNFIKNLNKEIWIKWSPIIYHYPIYNGSNSELFDSHLQLIEQTYKIVPENIIELLIQEIENKNEDKHLSFDRLERCWDEKLRDVLRNELSNPNLPISIKKQVLYKLFELKDSGAEKIACSLIKCPLPEDDETKQLLINAVDLLIQFGKTSCWDKIWQILNEDVEFGKKIIEEGSFRFGRQGLGRLPEEETANLYIWLSKNYPHNEDPNYEGMHFVGSREEITRWRDSLLDYLRYKGTSESVTAIEKIKVELPQLDWLKFMLLDAIETMREKTWQPLSANKLLNWFELEGKRNKVARLEEELAVFENRKNDLDKIAQRNARFRALEGWFLFSIIAIIWIIVIFNVGWDKMEIWTYVFTVVIGLILTGLGCWYLNDSFSLLSPSKIFEQEKAKMYEKHNLKNNEGELVSQELERAKRDFQKLKA